MTTTDKYRQNVRATTWRVGISNDIFLDFVRGVDGGYSSWPTFEEAKAFADLANVGVTEVANLVNTDAAENLRYFVIMENTDIYRVEVDNDDN